MKNFNPRKEIGPYNVLPSLRSCKKLPKAWFNHTYFIWYKDEWALPVKPWAPIPKPLIEAYDGELDKIEWYPCPTTEELFLKLPYARLISIGSRKYEAQYLDEATGECAVTTGKSPAEALCRCFLEIYKKTKGK